jgi:hypothetical protein
MGTVGPAAMRNEAPLNDAETDWQQFGTMGFRPVGETNLDMRRFAGS